MSRLLALLHTLLILLFIAGIYWWIEVPRLDQYSLQLFCLITLVYFIVKRINKSQIWQVLPAAMSIEVALATAGFLLLVGATGNLSSIFFPLIYVNLFLLVFASHTGTAIFVTFGEVLFHFALAHDPSALEISNLFSLPLILIILIFAKHQYQQSTRKTVKLEQDDALLHQEEQEVTIFINTFLKPKLTSLQTLITKNKTDQSETAIDDITQELENLENHLAGYLKEHEVVEEEG
jgi:hypothetical protein